MKSGGVAKNNVLDIIDYRGKRVIFTQKKWLEKCLVHPDLRSKKFIDNVEKAIKKPQIVWQDYDSPKEKRCYYWKYSASDYKKVVIWILSNPCEVVSAFETNYIKEAKYPTLKRIV